MWGEGGWGGRGNPHTCAACQPARVSAPGNRISLPPGPLAGLLLASRPPTLGPPAPAPPPPHPAASPGCSPPPRTARRAAARRPSRCAANGGGLPPGREERKAGCLRFGLAGRRAPGGWAQSSPSRRPLLLKPSTPTLPPLPPPQACVELLKPTGGKVHAFLACLPNSGGGAWEGVLRGRWGGWQGAAGQLWGRGWGTELEAGPAFGGVAACGRRVRLTQNARPPLRPVERTHPPRPARLTLQPQNSNPPPPQYRRARPEDPGPQRPPQREGQADRTAATGAGGGGEGRGEDARGAELRRVDGGGAAPPRVSPQPAAVPQPPAPR